MYGDLILVVLLLRKMLMEQLVNMVGKLTISFLKRKVEVMIFLIFNLFNGKTIVLKVMA